MCAREYYVYTVYNYRHVHVQVGLIQQVVKEQICQLRWTIVQFNTWQNLCILQNSYCVLICILVGTSVKLI